MSEGGCVKNNADCLCPTLYAQVCGVDGKTYNCIAKCAGVTIKYSRECKKKCIGSGCLEVYKCEPAECGTIRDQVCGTDGRDYFNECEANCSDVKVSHKGVCYKDTSNDCNSTCVSFDFSKGFCISEGSALEFVNHCTDIGGVSIDNVSGCNRTSYGSWDTCCCFKPTSVALSSLVKGCAETDKGMETRGADETERAPSITISGNQINYSRAINHQCCRKAVIEKEISGSAINIFEVWSGEGCRCICFSEIEATLENIPAGHYAVNVYEKGTKPDGTSMEQATIISKEIDVR
jgi:hypothetical protein